MTIQQENEIPIETEAIAKTSTEQIALTPTPPPTKADIILDIYREREKLKILRREVEHDIKRPSKKLSTVMYVTQLILSADKIILYAFKENNINISQIANIDISAEVNNLIKISREIKECKDTQLQPSATT